MKPKYITITKNNGKYDRFEITSTLDFFKDELILKVRDGKFIIQKSYIQYEGKTRRASKRKDGVYQIGFNNINLISGRFLVDEEEIKEGFIVVEL